MIKLERMRKIIDLSYEPDVENDGGFVAEVVDALLAQNACEQLESAGYEVSRSKDEQGRHYVWVM